MRLRTFLLLILVLLVIAAAVVAVFVLRSGGDLASLLPGGRAVETPETVAPAGQEPGLPTPAATPATQFATVVVARADLPVGERITAELIEVESRPESNVAVLAGVTFDNPEMVIGQIVKTKVSRGQEILRPMLALNPSDLATLGSDLSLYIDQGKVAVAFPMNRFSGAAFAIRPGDLVDMLMSLTLVELDPEFQTARLNVWERVFEPDLLEGRAFLFEPAAEGRLELIPVINTVAVIGPGQGETQIPRRVTQLTLQQVEVIWVGNWLDPTRGLAQEFPADAILSQEPVEPIPAEGEQALAGAEPSEAKERPENTPDVVIVSMSAQDALTLKWALETGIDVDLALRAQGDNSVFITTSVSLPQLVEQGSLPEPRPGDFGLEPRIEEVPPPDLPDIPPGLALQP